MINIRRARVEEVEYLVKIGRKIPRLIYKVEK